MSRLKHPARAIREPFGKAGLTVGIIALVLAMVGGAYAAGALSGKQKKEVEKIAKKYAGKPGANGPAGTNGTNGSPGAKGDTGVKGDTGPPGTSITNTTLPKGSPECPEGGSKFVGTSTTKACNGSPWTAAGVLPPEATETGVWILPKQSVKEKTITELPLSFPIPLSAPIEGTHVHYINEEGEELFENGSGEVEGRSQAACPGNSEEPTAEPGNLCVYQEFTSTESIVITSEQIQAERSTAGVFLLLSFSENNSAAAVAGSWAVTG